MLNFRVIMNKRRKFQWKQQKMRENHRNRKRIASASHLHHRKLVWVQFQFDDLQNFQPNGFQPNWNTNIQFQLKSKPKNEPTPTVTVEQVQDEKSPEDEKDIGDEKTEMSPPTLSEACQQAINASDSKTTCPLLRPSPSETSLTRSRSLEFPTQPKHSPDCKDNPYKL